MHKSIWEGTSKIKDFKELNGEIKTDVLVIGGGLCGILCAYYLQKSGINCILVEASKIAFGVTKNTTAKVTSQHGLIYSKLIKNIGISEAQRYLSAHQAAIAHYEKLCKNIDCNFEKRNSYIYSLESREKIEAEMNSLHRLGFNASFTKETELPFKIEGAVCFENQAQFNPLKLIAEISRDIEIYENTFVKELYPHKAITEHAVIKFNSAIVATHFPFINKHGSYFLKLYQERSYVSAFKNAQTLKGMYLDEKKEGLSFRTYKDILLIGGNNHRTGSKSTAWKPLTDFSKKYYPESTLVSQWATQDCISLDNMAYIGHYSKNTPDLYVATGFNKWGMTSSMLSAIVLTDMISGKKNEYANLFSPQRSILKPQLAVNAAETVFNFVTPTKKRCSHLGCALKWNKNEKTWDCPCHGSRFDAGGKVINNPAKKNLEK